jgi:hypothetical protein
MSGVTQADRDAALSLAMRAGTGLHPKDVADVLSGRHDKNAIVEAFARHRLAERERIRKMLGTERQALVVELREVGRDGVWKSGRNPISSHPISIKAADQIEADGKRIAELEAKIDAISAGQPWLRTFDGETKC